MNSAPTTTTALLKSLKDPAADDVWREFDARFRPLLTAFAVRLGLDPGEAEDVAQEILVEFVAAYRAGNYDRTRGRLSSWIITIAQHRISNRLRGARRAAGRRGESSPSLVADVRDAATLTAVWEVEERRLIALRALEVLSAGRMAEPTLQAFELFAVRGVPAEQAARECGMTVEEVYGAKRRVTGRLRAIVEELTAAWREGEQR